MDKIIWQLGADASQVFREMDKAIAAGKRFTVEQEQSAHRVDVAHERLLRSSHRVAAQIHTVARDFASGASAGDVFAASLEGIGRSLNIPLGALAGLAIGAVVAQKVAAVREEYQKLAKELKAVHEEASKSGDFKTMAILEAQAKRAEKAVEDLTNAIEGRSGKKGFGSQFKQFFSDVSNNLSSSSLWGKGPISESSERDAASRKQAYDDADKIEAQEVAKRRQQSGLRESALGGAPDSAIKAAQALIHLEENVGKGLDAAAESFREASITLRELVKARNIKAAERAGRSLEETANSLPDVVNNSVSFEQYQASQQAKRALALKAQGEAARLGGDAEGAHGLFNQSGEAAEGITGLKPSEKMSADFKGALEVTEDQLRQIAENTKKQFVNQ